MQSHYLAVSASHQTVTLVPEVQPSNDPPLRITTIDGEPVSSGKAHGEFLVASEVVTCLELADDVRAISG